MSSLILLLCLSAASWAVVGDAQCTPKPPTFALNWVPSTPIACCARAASAVVDGRLFIFGGKSWDTGKVVSNVYEFISGNQTWKERPSLPVPVQDAGGVAVESIVYVIGGSDDSNSRFQVQRYNATSNVWLEPGPDLPQKLRSSAVGQIDGVIYVAGGVHLESSTCKSVSKTLYSLNASDPEAKWQTLPEMKKGVFTAAGVSWERYLFVLGGSFDNGPEPCQASVATSTVYAFDTRTQTWNYTFPQLPQKTRSAMATVRYKHGSIYLLGGRNENNTPSQTIFTLNPLEDFAWIPNEQQPLYVGLDASGGTLNRDIIMACAGENSEETQILHVSQHEHRCTVYVDPTAPSQYACGSQERPCSSMQRALAAAEDGASIILTAGVYAGAENTGVMVSAIVNVTILGTMGETIIWCGNVNETMP